MPLRNPSDYADKSADSLATFSNLRLAELCELATPEVIEEHRRDPRGVHADHRDALQQLLNFARGLPIDAKIFIRSVKPFEEYRLATMAGRGATAMDIDGHVYSTEAEAAHAALVLRLTNQGVLQ
jgi:branched-chain amino acid transport system permease protein